MTSYEAVSAAIETAIRDLNGRLDIFIANSGIPWTQGAAVLGELDHYRQVVTTDLDGTFYCGRAAALHWIRQKKEQTTIDGKKLEPAFREGSFVATASMSGHIVNIPQLQATYNAAKAGVLHLCKFHYLLSILKANWAVRQVTCGRVGGLRALEHCLARVHSNGDFELLSEGDEGRLEEQDSHGTRRRGKRVERRILVLGVRCSKLYYWYGYHCRWRLLLAMNGKMQHVIPCGLELE